MPIRVALVDDDHNIHRLIADLLRDRADMTLVGQDFRGEDAVRLCQISQPDILLMDYMMPGLKGSEATLLVLDTFPHIRVLALSSYQEYEYILSMLNSGATSYLTKDALVDDLCDTIVMTYHGNTVLSPSVRQVLLAPPPANTDTYGLTERELEIVVCMGQGLTNRQVAHKLNITSSTVSFHLNNILDKMALHTRSEVLVVAAKQNLL